VRRHAAQLPPEWPPPDIACPVEPKPPREVEDDDEEYEDEDDELEPLPLCRALLLDANPTDVAFGGRLELVHRSRL
jgi:hypothetical protein